MHGMRGREVLRSIDASVHGLCSRAVCGVGRLECIERLHWMRRGEVRGGDGVALGVGMRGMHWWLDDGHTGVGGRHEVHGLCEREVLGGIDGSMRGLCSR